MDSNIARILLNNTNDAQRQRKTLSDIGQFDPAVMVDLFPGPAILVDGALNVSYHNVFANSLTKSLQEGDAVLKSIITRCLLNNCPDTQKASLNDSSGLRHYDLYALPIKQGKKAGVPLVFLFGKETTIEHNLTNALVESRQMFKDLVSCSTDFAWETDSCGNFIYVSPKGILGYTAYELNGKNSHDLIIGSDGRNPFDTLDKISDMELWLKRADGSQACLLVSSVPVLDNEGKWQGARGVSRDITQIREREAALRRIHKRELILNKIISSIRDMVSPHDMLEEAIRATMEGIKADYCCIIQKVKSPDGSIRAEVKQSHGVLTDQDMIYELCQAALKEWQTKDQNLRKTKVLPIGGHKILMSITSHHTEDNGAIFLMGNSKADWQDNDIHLLNGIATHLGIAIEQVITHAELETRAYTDELTSLKNRRAFEEDVNKRIKNQCRSRKDCALLYIDLDNFKNVNDSAGHATGDMILQELAKILNENTRVGDYSARLGGDEFAIWLDGISEEEALAKAENFVKAGSRLAHRANVSGPQLSISVGISISGPEAELSFEELMKNADKALYRVKEKGKGACEIYQAQSETEGHFDA